MTIIIMLIQWYTYGNSFHQLSYFEFAVYFEWNENFICPQLFILFKVNYKFKVRKLVKAINISVSLYQHDNNGHTISKSNILFCLKLFQLAIYSHFLFHMSSTFHFIQSKLQIQSTKVGESYYHKCITVLTW